MRSLADAKGKRIRTYGRIWPVAWKSIGAVPVGIASIEAYDALDKGMVDGAIGGTASLHKYKWYEAGKYITPELSSSPSHVYAITINLDLWNRLPTDIQRVMLETGRETLDMLGPFQKKQLTQMWADMKAAGSQILEPLPVTELNNWFKLPVFTKEQEKWVKAAEAKGYPGRKYLNRYLELMKQCWD